MRQGQPSAIKERVGGGEEGGPRQGLGSMARSSVSVASDISDHRSVVNILLLGVIGHIRHGRIV